MKIFNVSHVSFPDEDDPLKWIAKSRFFKGAWEAVAETDEVIFTEFINYDGKIKQNGIQYWFQKKSRGALRFPLQVHRSIAKAKPDIVLVHGMLFPLQILLLRFCLHRNCKIIVQDHGGGMFQHPLKKYLQTLADRCVDAYFFTAKEQAQRWIEAGVIRDSNKVKEVMEISSVFQPEPRAEALAFTHIATQNNYLFVGHLNANKDPLLIVRAFMQFVSAGADAHLYMIFQSETLLPQLQVWLADHPQEAQHIHLVGKVSHDELQHWFGSSDFIISASHFEAGGVSVCEAMSCGCIPVLSNIPSFLFMTGNACGIIFEKGREDALLKALQESSRLNLLEERQKVLTQFEEQLSFKAIANRIRDVLYHL